MIAVELARKFIGTCEVPGSNHSAFIQWCHESVGLVDEPDETSWCSSFVNRVCDMLGFQRSKSAAARSWLSVGEEVPSLSSAVAGNDVVVFWRGEKGGWQGHVGFYVSHDAENVQVLGGNQGDKVSIANYPISRLLGIRRLRA